MDGNRMNAIAAGSLRWFSVRHWQCTGKRAWWTVLGSARCNRLAESALVMETWGAERLLSRKAHPRRARPRHPGETVGEFVDDPWTAARDHRSNPSRVRLLVRAGQGKLHCLWWQSYKYQDKRVERCLPKNGVPSEVAHPSALPTTREKGKWAPWRRRTVCESEAGLLKSCQISRLHARLSMNCRNGTQVAWELGTETLQCRAQLGEAGGWRAVRRKP